MSLCVYACQVCELSYCSIELWNLRLISNLGPTSFSSTSFPFVFLKVWCLHGSGEGGVSYTHTQAYVHTYTHVHVRTNTRAQIWQAYTRNDIHTHTCRYACIQAHTLEGQVFRGRHISCKYASTLMAVTPIPVMAKVLTQQRQPIHVHSTEHIGSGHYSCT